MNPNSVAPSGFRRQSNFGLVMIALALAMALPASAAQQRNRGGLPDVVEGAVVSVVNISSTKVVHLEQPDGAPPQHPFYNDPFFRHFFGPDFEPNIPKERREKSLGSGVVVTADGVILTNSHVVEHAEDIIVTLSDGRELEAKAVGSDPKSDVAVIKLKEPVDGLIPLPFGDSDKLRLAETVLAIGNPFGVGQTVTSGIVSAVGRANIGIVDYEDFIQTDAAINPGNSGGALINSRGELVGINTAIISRSGGYQGIGFAIPSNMARSIMDSLLEHGKVIRGWLGVMIQPLDKDIAEAMGLSDAKGVLVSDVTEESPAAEAGLLAGDVVLQVDGKDTETTGQLRNIIAGKGAGTKVRLSIVRNEERKTIKVTLGELPAEYGGTAGAVEASEELGGLSVGSLTEEARERFEIDKDTTGVVVTDVDPGSEAFRQGLRPGDVIVEADRKPLESPKQFAEAYEGAEQRLLLLVHRGDGTRFVVLKKD